MAELSRVRFEGPLAPHSDKLWGHVLAEGYTPLSGRNLLRLAAHLSRWLIEQRIGLDSLSPNRLDAFLRYRRESGYTSHLSQRSLQPLLSCLRKTGVVPVQEEAVGARTPIDKLLDSYEEYMVQERGVTSATVDGYGRSIRRFLIDRFGAGDLGLKDLTPADVSSFVLREARCCSVGYAKLKVSALRSFLRFLCVRGDVAHDLVAAVPSVAGWRLAGLPKGLTPSELRELLRGCDRRTHVGRRNYAVLLVLVRLGLRAGEAARLRLDDISWDRGELTIRGKGSREDYLPLPCDVGEAMASYLKRSRPQSTSRRLFLQARAPFRDLTRGTVTAIVTTACYRVGISPGGAHRLRHTAAVQMLRCGASLPEIAQVLRHQSLSTTAIYAKVDRDALRELALPWPGEKS